MFDGEIDPHWKIVRRPVNFDPEVQLNWEPVLSEATYYLADEVRARLHFLRNFDMDRADYVYKVREYVTKVSTKDW